MKRAMHFLGLVVLACVTCAVAVWQLHAREALKQWDPLKARAAGRPVPVRTVKVEQREITETVGGTAVTLPAQTVFIEVAGTDTADREVTEVFGKPGATIAKGDKLVEFNPTLFKQVVAQREAELQMALAQLETLTDLASKNAASGMQVSAAKVAVKTAEVELEVARNELGLCEITSPIDGVIEEIALVPGVRVSNSASRVVIHQLDPIYVVMDYPMERLDALEVGQQAEVSLDAYPQEKLTGKVVSVSPVVSTKTRVVPVTIEVANPNNRIRAGISGFARVTGEQRSAKVAPNVAVIDTQDRAMVIRVEDDRVKLREVHTGAIVQAGYTEVEDGLEVGDEIVIYGQDEVREGDVVNTNWREWTRREPLADAKR